MKSQSQRIEALVAEKTAPENRSEQEIAGYRDVLAMIHANGADIPFEPKYVMQLHGTMHRYVGTRDAGKWKTVRSGCSTSLGSTSGATSASRS